MSFSSPKNKGREIAMACQPSTPHRVVVNSRSSSPATSSFGQTRISGTPSIHMPHNWYPNGTPIRTTHRAESPNPSVASLRGSSLASNVPHYARSKQDPQPYGLRAFEYKNGGNRPGSANRARSNSAGSVSTLDSAPSSGYGGGGGGGGNGNVRNSQSPDIRAENQDNYSNYSNYNNGYNGSNMRSQSPSCMSVVSNASTRSNSSKRGHATGNSAIMRKVKAESRFFERTVSERAAQAQAAEARTQVRSMGGIAQKQRQGEIQGQTQGSRFRTLSPGPSKQKVLQRVDRGAHHDLNHDFIARRNEEMIGGRSCVHETSPVSDMRSASPAAARAMAARGKLRLGGGSPSLMIRVPSQVHGQDSGNVVDSLPPPPPPPPPLPAGSMNTVSEPISPPKVNVASGLFKAFQRRQQQGDGNAAPAAHVEGALAPPTAPSDLLAPPAAPSNLLAHYGSTARLLAAESERVKTGKSGGDSLFNTAALATLADPPAQHPEVVAESEPLTLSQPLTHQYSAPAPAPAPTPVLEKKTLVIRSRAVTPSRLTAAVTERAHTAKARELACAAAAVVAKHNESAGHEATNQRTTRTNLQLMSPTEADSGIPACEDKLSFDVAFEPMAPPVPVPLQTQARSRVSAAPSPAAVTSGFTQAAPSPSNYSAVSTPSRRPTPTRKAPKPPTTALTLTPSPAPWMSGTTPKGPDPTVIHAMTRRRPVAQGYTPQQQPQQQSQQQSRVPEVMPSVPPPPPVADMKDALYELQFFDASDETCDMGMHYAARTSVTGPRRSTPTQPAQQYARFDYSGSHVTAAIEPSGPAVEGSDDRRDQFTESSSGLRTFSASRSGFAGSPGAVSIVPLSPTAAALDPEQLELQLTSSRGDGVPGRPGSPPQLQRSGSGGGVSGSPGHLDRLRRSLEREPAPVLPLGAPHVATSFVPPGTDRSTKPVRTRQNPLLQVNANAHAIERPATPPAPPEPEPPSPLPSAPPKEDQSGSLVVVSASAPTPAISPRGLPSVLSFSKLEVDESFCGGILPSPIQNVVVSWVSKPETATATAAEPVVADPNPTEDGFTLLDLDVTEEVWERKAVREQEQEQGQGVVVRAARPTLASVEAATAAAKGAIATGRPVLASPEPEPNITTPPQPTPYSPATEQIPTAGESTPQQKTLSKRGSLTPLLSRKPSVDWNSVRRRNRSVGQQASVSVSVSSAATTTASASATSPVPVPVPVPGAATRGTHAGKSGSDGSMRQETHVLESETEPQSALKRRPSLLMGQADSAALHLFRRPSLLAGEPLETDSDDEPEMVDESEGEARLGEVAVTAVPDQEAGARGATVDDGSDDSDDEQGTGPGLKRIDTLGVLDSEVVQYDSDDELFFSPTATGTASVSVPVSVRVPSKRASAPAFYPPTSPQRPKKSVSTPADKTSGAEATGTVDVQLCAMSASMLNISVPDPVHVVSKKNNVDSEAALELGAVAAVGEHVLLPDGTDRSVLVPNKHVHKVVCGILAYNAHYNISYGGNLLPKLRLYYANPTAVGTAGAGVVALDATAVRKLLTLLGGSKLAQQTSAFQVSEFGSYLKTTSDSTGDGSGGGVALANVEVLLEYYFLHLPVLGYPPRHIKILSTDNKRVNNSTTDSQGLGASYSAPTSTLSAKQKQTKKIASAAKRLFG